MPHDYLQDEDNKDIMIRSCGVQGMKSDTSDFSGERRGSDWCNQADLPPSTLMSRKHSTLTDSANNITRVIESIDTLGLTKKREVESTLRKYGQTFPSSPGLCRGFKYGFEFTDYAPRTTKDRTVPYRLRDAVRQQIDVMLRNGGMAPSTSPYYNPSIFKITDKHGTLKGTYNIKDLKKYHANGD
jgi:hypothetical protein